jgi:hypothetical protein
MVGASGADEVLLQCALWAEQVLAQRAH